MLCENTVVCVNSFFYSFLKIICILYLYYLFSVYEDILLKKIYLPILTFFAVNVLLSLLNYFSKMTRRLQTHKINHYLVL